MGSTTDETKAKASAPENEDSQGKEAIYEMVGNYVKEKTDKRIGKTGGREIFDLITEQIFALATKEGSFRFNGGFGSLHVKNYQAGSRRLPSGTQTTFGERQKLRYEEGVVVKALVKNKGNLKAALEVRGKRTPKVEEAKAPAKTKAVKPAKEPAKAAAKEPAKAATAAAQPEAELDLS